MNFPACPIAFIEGLGGPEMMMIMFIILLLFGADRMPGLAKGIGKSIREFKKAASGVEDEIRQAMDEDPESLPKKFPADPPPTAANSLPTSPRMTSTAPSPNLLPPSPETPAPNTPAPPSPPPSSPQA